VRHSVLIALLVLFAAPAVAGPAFFPGTLGEKAFTPTKDAPGFEIRHSDTTLHLTDGAGTYALEETFRGEGPVVGWLPLPKGTSGEGVVVTVNGATVKTTVYDAKASRAILRRIAEGAQSPGILTWSGQPGVLLQGVTLGRRTRVKVEMPFKVADAEGLWSLTVPMPAAHLATKPLRRARLTAHLKHSETPIRAALSPTHEVKIARVDRHTVTLRATAERLADDTPFRAFWAVDDDPVGLRVLTHRPEGDAHGYFLLFGNPGDDGSAQIAKDVLLVVDASGSMRGAKWEQAQAAVDAVLERLGPDDRFDVVTFGTEVQRFAPALSANSATQRTAARTFLDAVVPLGRTNISEALAAALGGKAQADRPRIVLFLTDGAPTAGQRDPAKILLQVEAAKKNGARVFALGVGHDVNAHLLDQVASLTDGSTLYVAPGDPIDVEVANLYDQLSHPVLTQVTLDFGGLKADRLSPAAPPTLFRGQDVLVFGRYAKGGAHTIGLSGTLAGEKKTFSTQATFPSTAQPDHDFIANLWATRRVGDLLHDLRLEGHDEKKVTEVVELSRRFGILTEYTRFLADVDEELDDAEAAKRATVLMKNANAQASGSWAVFQAGNESRLRNKVVANNHDNNYRDRQGKQRASRRLKQVGTRTFYKRGDKWVQTDTAKKPSKRRKMKRYSAEYYDLVEKSRDFARSQSLEGEVELTVGDEQITVY
jgi:Ca-activated chloride channel homolog